MDQLREDARERTWEDYVEDAGAVLAIGAGAAYFLKHGGGVERLSRFGEYLTGARRAYSEGAFEHWNIKQGIETTKQYVLSGNTKRYTDLTQDKMLQSLYAGADIVMGGRTKDLYSSQYARNFQLNYGKALYREMLSGVDKNNGLLLDQTQIDMLHNMISDFTHGEDVDAVAIGTKIRRWFGEDASEDAIAQAELFANELQNRMRDETNPNSVANQIKRQNIVTGKGLSADVQEFLGFDPNTGQGIWNPSNVIEHMTAANPDEQTKQAGEIAKNVIAVRKAQDTYYGSWAERAKTFLLGEHVTYKEVEDAINAGEFDIKEFAERNYYNGGNDSMFLNTFEALRDIRNNGSMNYTDLDRQEFDKLIIGGLRRNSAGKIYSTANLEGLAVDSAEMFADTLPGKMLRITESMYSREQPMFAAFNKGTLDYALSKSLGNSRYELETIRDVMRIHGDFYEYVNGAWEKSDRLRDFTLAPNKVGASRDLFQAARDAERAALRGQNGFFNGFRNFRKSEIKALREQYGNQFDWALHNPNFNAAQEYAEILSNTPRGAETLNRIQQLYRTTDRYSHLENELTAAGLNTIFNSMGSINRTMPDAIPNDALIAMDRAVKIISDPTGREAIRYASQYGTLSKPERIANVGLANLIANFQKNPEPTIRQMITRVDQAKKNAGSVHFYSQSFDKNLAQELVREAFLQIRTNKKVAGQDPVDVIEEVINRSFKGEKASNLRSFVATSIFNADTSRGVYELSDSIKAGQALNVLNNIRNGATKEDRFVFNSLEELSTRFNFKGERVNFSAAAESFDRTGNWAVVHKAYSFPTAIKTAINMVRNANDKERTKALINAAVEAAKPLTQFVAGGGRMSESMSSLSYFGYNMMNLVDKQLNRDFNLFGRHFSLRLGLDKQDKGSAAAIAANLVLKRVAPIAFGITYLDFLDDSARAITGMGLGEAGVSGLANAYLGVKKITGATGLDYVFKGITSDSPFADYYADYTGDIDPTWKSYEEQKDYYERGYTPIRKARFWAFGSSNEYRGGRISYFEPNTLRMMRSNYYMESMYEGSMWTKWSHSLLPTPLNPLSPINYLLDPYYLEELHKEDRPYPVTGSTFAENTPWGIVLNPVFDTFVKPRRQMHRDRLGSDGVDVKALIEHINDNIRRRANNQQNGDIIYLQNGKLRSMLFTAFNAPTPSERIVGQQGNSVTMSTEYGEYGAGINGEEYTQAVEANAEQLGGSSFGIGPVNSEKLSVSDRLVISSAKGNVAAGVLVDSLKMTGVFDALRGANIKIRQKGMLRKDQGMFYENKMQYESSAVDDLLANSETISDLMTQGQGHDYIHEMAVSTRMITGLYGYMASLAFGMGQNNQKRIATSANMESAGRSFWDLGIGGYDPLYGDIMEIMRRFIPEYHRMQQVNPLMNTMPDWLPDRFRMGDPFASIPKGEARLPGRGYESLNKLHPDIFGNYGAFDRFKILADVAPYSPEYKFWKKVAGATIQDPELKKEIQEIKDRVAEQTKGHDFYDYKYIGRGMTQQNAVVSEILNFGKFKIVGSEQVYKLSGVKISGNPNETTQQVLSRYILPGQEITMFMDENPAYARNNDKDKTINAGVMIAGENVAEQMLEAGDAKKRKGDTSAPSYMLNHGNVVNTLNMAQEFIGHLNIPIFHSRLMNMNSPLESYLDDNVYGTSFQNWSHVWDSFIKPSLQIQASNPYILSTGIIANIISNNLNNEGQFGVRNVIRETLEQTNILQAFGKNVDFSKPVSSGLKSKAAWAARFLDRGALVGHFAGRIGFMGSSESLSKAVKLQKVGSVMGLAYAAMANPNNLAVSTIAWSRLGYQFANEMLHKNRTLATMTGAAIGAIRWASAQKMLASDDLANTYIPDSTRKKWDMQEYFDRLTYIKYMGLYEQAADMAESKEGINIRAIIAAQERERAELKEEKDRLHKDLIELDNQHDADSEEAKKIIRRRLNSMSGVKLGLRGGEFTKSAIMYKNAADATMFGLSEDALMADIVRALPKTERDYFIEFMKEKDKEKREEILKTVSPLLNRALRTIWKMPLPEKISNEEYFEHHTLPAPTWAGWRPDIDLANVAAKVIYNEGMQYSDMGIYASQYREPDVINAPNIDYSEEQRSTLLTRLKLQMALTGTGLDASKVSVEPSQDSDIKVVANIARVIPYKIGEEFDKLLSF